MTLHKFIPALTFASMALVACEPSRENKIAQDAAASEATVSEPAKSTAAVAKPVAGTDWAAFEAIYSYAQEGTTQKLGVKYLPDNKIEFRLLETNSLCDIDYGGVAQNLYPDSDGESDEDEEGNGYFVTEYTFEDDESRIYIRIADEKDKAKIKFADKTKEDTDCVPSPDLILK